MVYLNMCILEKMIHTYLSIFNEAVVSAKTAKIKSHEIQVLYGIKFYTPVFNIRYTPQILFGRQGQTHNLYTNMRVGESCGFYLTNIIHIITRRGTSFR